MPTLLLRRLGMSHLIEGMTSSGLDAQRLLRDLTAAHGLAVAPMTGAEPSSDPNALAAILVDHKAASWESLRDWLEHWVRNQGYAYASWSENGLAGQSRATLHFHRTPLEPNDPPSP